MKRIYLKKKKPSRLYYIIQVEVRDKDGNLIYRSKPKIGRSFVQNFLAVLSAYFSGKTGTTGISFTDTSANTWFFPNSFTQGTDWLLNAPSGDQNFGILIGSSTTPQNSAAYNLGSPLRTNWAYAAVVFSAPSVSGSQTIFGLSRQFTNNTGASQNVGEAGMVLKLRDQSGVTRYMLIAHDILPGAPLSVPAGGTITISYSFVLSA